jgi:hypothetical protein
MIEIVWERTALTLNGSIQNDLDHGAAEFSTDLCGAGRGRRGGGMLGGREPGQPGFCRAPILSVDGRASAG